LSKNFLVKKEVWDGALSRCIIQFFCCQCSGRNLRILLRCRIKTSQ
jgi:hypothetical protein